MVCTKRRTKWHLYRWELSLVLCLKWKRTFPTTIANCSLIAVLRSTFVEIRGKKKPSADKVRKIPINIVPWKYLKFPVHLRYRVARNPKSKKKKKKNRKKKIKKKFAQQFRERNLGIAVKRQIYARRFSISKFVALVGSVVRASFDTRDSCAGRV